MTGGGEPGEEDLARGADIRGGGACSSVRTTRLGAVGVVREQRMFVSSETIDRQADQAYRQTLRQAQAAGRLNRNPEQLERVRTIAHRLIATTGVFRSDAPGWHWEVNVLASKEVNAWCMPGGKMAVYAGLLDRLQPTDDELAAVIGHEIAHALREHGRERAGQSAGVGVVAAIAGAVLGASSGVEPALGRGVFETVGDFAFMRPNSREVETEADRIGVEMAARAGYDPYAAIGLWQKMGQASDGEPPPWLSTHPSHASRIADLRRYAERVAPLLRSRSVR